MKNHKHVNLFNKIAWAYRFFTGSQSGHYSSLIRENGALLPAIDPLKPVLDMGCGTGAFSLALMEAGYPVLGVDPALKMLRFAARKGVISVNADAAGELPFRDGSFSLVTAAFVVHGLPRELRLLLHREAARVSTGLVLYHDFNRGKNRLISFIESLEGGGYFEFIETGEDEMRTVFKEVSVIPVSGTSSWYLCRV